MEHQAPLCTKGRGGGTIKEHWNVWQMVLMDDQRWQSHVALAETHRKRWEEHICNTLVLDMVRVVVIVAITPEQVQPPKTSVQ